MGMEKNFHADRNIFSYMQKNIFAYAEIYFRICRKIFLHMQKFIFVYAKIYWCADGNKLACGRECAMTG
ncbi:hypothetical protein HQ29_08455 [Porphyromonas canoris]|nr:hypothetical protein HQ29_08455 [Porphyromonas canoris]